MLVLPNLKKLVYFTSVLIHCKRCQCQEQLHVPCDLEVLKKYIYIHYQPQNSLSTYGIAFYSIANFKEASYSVSPS